MVVLIDNFYEMYVGSAVFVQDYGFYLGHVRQYGVIWSVKKVVKPRFRR